MSTGKGLTLSANCLSKIIEQKKTILKMYDAGVTMVDNDDDSPVSKKRRLSSGSSNGNSPKNSTNFLPKVLDLADFRKERDAKRCSIFQPTDQKTGKKSENKYIDIRAYYAVGKSDTDATGIDFRPTKKGVSFKKEEFEKFLHKTTSPVHVCFVRNV